MRGSLFVLLPIGVAIGCGDDDEPGTTQESSGSSGESEATASPAGEARTPAETETPADLPNALLLAYAQFVVENGAVTARPGPARLEILRRVGGEWAVEALEDETAAVFHKAIVFTPPGGRPGILTLSGVAPRPEGGQLPHEPAVKLWHAGPEGWTPTTLWAEDFGGRFNRMRDAEIADLYGDGKPDIAVATHDRGIVAVLRAPEEAGGAWRVERLDRQEDIFIHEIEVGDVNRDGTLEVYATPSEPNRLEGGAQHGEVIRFVPKDGQGRTVVADLGNRHAKEIYVGDVDGDGTDELYVAVEALTAGERGETVVEPVQIRRYEQDTAPEAGAVIGTINDRFTRFLTVGDFDGDGKNEMIAASFSSGVWLLKPGTDPRGEWAIESIDRDSGGFEHAALAADLDGDGADELYVAADEQGELRRYVWRNGRARREVIHRRELPRSMMTWNITAAPLSALTPGG
jgi:hypothetical protein